MSILWSQGKEKLHGACKIKSMKNLPQTIRQAFQNCLKKGGKLCFLTGAGLSVESGIRTFRGKEGYWTVGSDVYTPQEMATMKLYSSKPKVVWEWYLQRFLNYLEASPNEAHLAIASLQKTYGEQIELITQNIDNLHRRAGSAENLYEIHGNMTSTRCSHDPSPLLKLPDNLLPLLQLKDYEKIWPLLQCPICDNELVRPHVLWFDESYNEAYYKVYSAWDASRSSEILIVIGSTGATSIPAQIVSHHLDIGHIVIIIDPHSSELSRMVSKSDKGVWLQKSAVEAMREILSFV